MKKGLAMWFWAGFAGIAIIRIWLPASVVEIDTPLLGLLQGLFTGSAQGFLIVLIARINKKFEGARSSMFADLFAICCGLSVGNGLFICLDGFLFPGILYVVGKLIMLFAFYQLTYRWWKKAQEEAP